MNIFFVTVLLFKVLLYVAFDNNKKLKNSGFTYQFDSENYKNDVREWGTKAIWWGRRNKGFETVVYEK